MNLYVIGISCSILQYICTILQTIARTVLSIKSRLLEIRKLTGLSQSDFAKKFGVSSRAYAGYELGERELPLSFVAKMNDELSIDPNWLIFGGGARTTIKNAENFRSAIIEVQSLALEENLKFKPEEMAKLVFLLVEYFEQTGEINKPFARKILELQR